jgi:hypothetical protein
VQASRTAAWFKLADVAVTFVGTIEKWSPVVTTVPVEVRV